MRHLPGLLVTLASLSACGSPNPDNSAVCGIASIAGASMALQQIVNEPARLTNPPGGMASRLPARVVGYAPAQVLVTDAPNGVVMGYEGTGFPTRPGFGILLVDDSSEVVRGVLIFDKEEQDLPKIGTISGSTSTIPLYGLRVNWGSVSDARCPIFGTNAADSGRK
jgi:hypothetical protein